MLHQPITTEALAATLNDAAGHVADALPELLVLARGGDHFAKRLRPYLDEIVHCLTSALEAVLEVSRDADAAGIGSIRREGEEALAVMARDFLDRATV